MGKDASFLIEHCRCNAVAFLSSTRFHERRLQSLRRKIQTGANLVQHRSAATVHLVRANGLRSAQQPLLRDARASLAWYLRDLVRYAFASGDVAVPREGANVATIRRIPRTIPGSDGTPEANPDAFTGDTFKDVMYADGKRVFSVIDDDVGGDEFKVDGYIGWLSNHVGVLARNLEPPAGSGMVIFPDGSRRASFPHDGAHHYLKYAAYGLFIYATDLETFRGSGRDAGYDGHVGRNHTLHFGYLAFGTGAGQKTADIGEAIAGGEFRWYTLAYEVLGDSNLERAGGTGVETKLLRGDVALTVDIPKGSGLGALEGTMSNFQEWHEENGYWTAYVDSFTVAMERVVISESGLFTGKVRATPHAGFGSAGAGDYKGSFYGPRADANDLEIAGSWNVGTGQPDDGLKDIYGSTGDQLKRAGWNPNRPHQPRNYGIAPSEAEIVLRSSNALPSRLKQGG